MGGEKAIKCLGSGFNKQNEKMRAHEDLELSLNPRLPFDGACPYSSHVTNQSIPIRLKLSLYYNDSFKPFQICWNPSDFSSPAISSFWSSLTVCWMQAGRWKLSHTTILLTFSGRTHLSGKCIFLYGTTM